MSETTMIILGLSAISAISVIFVVAVVVIYYINKNFNALVNNSLYLIHNDPNSEDEYGSVGKVTYGRILEDGSEETLTVTTYVPMDDYRTISEFIGNGGFIVYIGDKDEGEDEVDDTMEDVPAMVDGSVIDTGINHGTISVPIALYKTKVSVEENVESSVTATDASDFQLTSNEGTVEPSDEEKLAKLYEDIAEVRERLQMQEKRLHLQDDLKDIAARVEEPREEKVINMKDDQGRPIISAQEIMASSRRRTTNRTQ